MLAYAVVVVVFVDVVVAECVDVVVDLVVDDVSVDVDAVEGQKGTAIEAWRHGQDQGEFAEGGCGIGLVAVSGLVWRW